jgi:hypothetical protein
VTYASPNNNRVVLISLVLIFLQVKEMGGVRAGVAEVLEVVAITLVRIRLRSVLRYPIRYRILTAAWAVLAALEGASAALSAAPAVVAGVTVAKIL